MKIRYGETLKRSILTTWSKFRSNVKMGLLGIEERLNFDELQSRFRNTNGQKQQFYI